MGSLGRRAAGQQRPMSLPSMIRFFGGSVPASLRKRRQQVHQRRDLGRFAAGWNLPHPPHQARNPHAAFLCVYPQPPSGPLEPCGGCRRGAPLSEVQMIKVFSSIPNSSTVSSRRPSDQSSSSTESPQGPFFDLPLNARWQREPVLNRASLQGSTGRMVGRRCPLIHLTAASLRTRVSWSRSTGASTTVSLCISGNGGQFCPGRGVMSSL